MPVRMVANEELWQECKERISKLTGWGPLEGKRYWRLVMITYRRLGGAILQHTHKSEDMLHTIDLEKGSKGNRDGLIQQIVTYVRDGHTVVRKQWVRSEFADHASKDEDEKKDTILHEEERKEAKRRNDLKEDQQKHARKDARDRKKEVRQAKEEEGKGIHHGRSHKYTDKALEEYKDKMKKKKEKAAKEEKDRKDKQNSHNKKENKQGGSSHGAYGQGDQTRADNRREQLMIRPK